MAQRTRPVWPFVVVCLHALAGAAILTFISLEQETAPPRTYSLRDTVLLATVDHALAVFWVLLLLDVLALVAMWRWRHPHARLLRTLYVAVATTIVALHLSGLFAAIRVGTFRDHMGAVCVIEGYGIWRGVAVGEGFLILPPLIALAVQARLSRTRGDRRCSDCGYDLAGLPPKSENCPECGGRIPT